MHHLRDFSNVTAACDEITAKNAADFFLGASGGKNTDINILMDNSCKYVITPGLCDVHVHFREPGFSYKERIKTGSAAAARGWRRRALW